MKITVSLVLAGLIFCNTVSAVVIQEEESYNITSIEEQVIDIMEQATSRFFPLSSSPPPASVFPTISHPFPPIYADNSLKKVVPTNSWISNLFYPSVNNLAPTTPDPYILRLLDDFGGNPGLSVSQPYDKIIGSYPPINNIPAIPAGYIINGVVVDFRITSSEWKSERPSPLVTSWDLFGANLRLSGAGGNIEFPLARGTPFITSIYNNLTPQFYTQHAIIRITADHDLSGDTYSGYKFKVSFNNSPTSTYIIYVLGDQPLTLRKEGFSNLVATSPYNGVIQIAKLPDNPEGEAILDAHKGIWATGASVDTNADSTSYTIKWHVKGDLSKKLLAYAYPHHISSFLNDGSVEKTGLVLQSSSKGPMQAVVGNTWKLKENDLPNIEWFPARPAPEASTRNEILENLAADVNTNYTKNTQKGDNYFSGKGLQKYALLALTLNRPELTQLHNKELAETSLNKLKAAFVPYLENRQQNPYRYDSLYKGIVSRDGLPVEMGGTGNINTEFGHTYYNDHHYHQGYLVVTAAIILHLDSTWRAAELKDWTETLIRDVNNPVEEDPYFAQFRNWDWFAGHSWAGGIKVDGALDGRDQESVPESVNFYWGVKLWGLATGNRQMADLANLQLAITKRSTYEYFWYMDNNKNRPIEMVKNKVAGIFFEQKVDYTTYFGRYLEFVHGIQQLPMTPILAEYIRVPEFVHQEWDQKLQAIAPTIKSPWAGVLYLNYATINPSDAYPTLRKIEMDDGQTRSYSLYLAATRPGFFRRSFSKLMKDQSHRKGYSNIEEEDPHVDTDSVTESAQPSSLADSNL